MIYTREFTVTYIVTDEVEANSNAEAETLPITVSVPDGAKVDYPRSVEK